MASMAQSDDEDEWEYEYDDTETEDFYITLDLSNVQEKGGDAPVSGRPIQPSLSGHPLLLQSRLRALNQKMYANVANASTTDGGAEPAPPVESIQITGLHTRNPLVKYRDKLLSCTWASTVGTDMLFVKPGPDSSGADRPLRSLPSVDLLGLSSTKLVATEARLRPRDEVYENMSVDGETTTARTAAARGNAQTGSELTEEPRGAPVASSFLSRLNDLKAKRGEKSRLAVSETRFGTRLRSEQESNNVSETVPGTASDVEMRDAEGTG
ncbi:uncharacterized protein EI97DRAFT_504475 [Westerdykella ornata]|uniref:Transcription factor TFIIIC triple barrel domain-containing protein n=1 Tax=Westerdykella ornata TaxID=318751 RepID=A0A6A6J6E7_WESOR|nr:uncharacterized protein EI97DRAFT_504475 [Westerdykella ornata]KAF2272150.1 hypothetical protein EI97DRAFT_504475 [Westerdykella ornata]